MLNDASGFQKIYLATGYTDLRRGMEGLANIIRFHFHLDPYDRNTLFLFCGKRTYRIKGVFCQVLFPEKSVGIPFFQQGIFPAFSGHYASLRMRACSIR